MSEDGHRGSWRGHPGNVEAAAIGLRDLHGGELPTGTYRVRAVDLDDPAWISAEVDDHGVFRAGLERHS